MRDPITIPKWMITLGTVVAAVFGVFVGIASAAWSARSMVDAQTAAIASLQQTLDQTVRPALAEVDEHTRRIGEHTTQIAVIERTCCDDTPTRSTAGGTP